MNLPDLPPASAAYSLLYGLLRLGSRFRPSLERPADVVGRLRTATAEALDREFSDVSIPQAVRSALTFGSVLVSGIEQVLPAGTSDRLDGLTRGVPSDLRSFPLEGVTDHSSQPVTPEPFHVPTFTPGGVPPISVVPADPPAPTVAPISEAQTFVVE